MDSSASVRSPATATCALVAEVLDALDYERLALLYCDEGGMAFWREHRPAVLELGLEWGGQLLARLPRGGRSLYVGAGVAELPALVVEVVELDRNCVVGNLRGAECEVLNAALARVGLEAQLQLVARDAAALVEPGAFDHLSLVSVLSDPETYPTVSEVAYGRASAVHLDTAVFDDERRRIRALVAALMAALTIPATVTTTFEEVAWLLAWAEQSGRTVVADDAIVDTAVVGDPVGFLRIGGAA